MCVCVYASRHLCLGDELRDLLAGVERCHLPVSHAPVGPARGVQDLVMFLQDFTETSEVQVLWTETNVTYSHQTNRVETLFIPNKTGAGNIKRNTAKHTLAYMKMSVNITLKTASFLPALMS